MIYYELELSRMSSIVSDSFMRARKQTFDLSKTLFSVCFSNWQTIRELILKDEKEIIQSF